MRTWIFIVATVLGSVVPVAAQVPDVCSVAFTQGIRNNYDVFTEEERFNLFKQRILSLRSESYQQFRSSAQSVGLDLNVLDVLLNLSGSSDERESHFRSHFEEFRAATYSQARYRFLFQRLRST